ncbi:hypothetical protein PG985_003742 [Apiospora marii]|uniref:Uncharacterized protein n=1 Tax=Apiospora marii TaxID=335849 RepID=A0ABR1SHC8_9PEZI
MQATAATPTTVVQDQPAKPSPESSENQWMTVIKKAKPKKAAQHIHFSQGLATQSLLERHLNGYGITLKQNAKMRSNRIPENSGVAPSPSQQTLVRGLRGYPATAVPSPMAPGSQPNRRQGASLLIRPDTVPRS